MKIYSVFVESSAFGVVFKGSFLDPYKAADLWLEIVLPLYPKDSPFLRRRVGQWLERSDKHHGLRSAYTSLVEINVA